MCAKRLTAQQKKEVFHALVTTQDMGLMTVSESVQHVAKQFEITEAQSASDRRRGHRRRMAAPQ